MIYTTKRMKDETRWVYTPITPKFIRSIVVTRFRDQESHKKGPCVVGRVESLTIKVVTLKRPTHGLDDSVFKSLPQALDQMSEYPPTITTNDV